MDVMDFINIVAIIVSPIIAVWVGQKLQIKARLREDKMQIFKSLMTARIYGWTTESVHNLNVIDLVFADDKLVRAAWKDLFDKYANENPTDTDLQKIRISRDKLIEQMAVSLGYKDKITWETIQNPYVPKGMMEQLNKNATANNDFLVALSMFLQIMQKTQSSTNTQEDGADE